MPKVFISYSHKDEAWKDRLQTQLAVLQMQGLLSVWEDRQIEAGDDWYPEIEQALNSADVALLLISANFLSSKFILGEEIPRLLERRKKEGIRVIPLILKPCPWRKVGWLSAMQGASRDNVELSGLNEHEQDNILSKLAETVHDLVCGTKPGHRSPVQVPNLPGIHTDRLPTVKGEFFGRVAELKILDDAWAGNGTKIIQFIAPGGTGKTKLLRHWLDSTQGIDALIAWSFYSQGSSEDKQTSATPFFTHALEKLGSTRDRFTTEEDKGEHLAELLRRQRCVLVLDGLEPLQHAGTGMRGELKDRALRQLLKSLAGKTNGLCIITTRIAVHELAGRAQVISHDLQNLHADDGIKLLQALGVQGRPAELHKAVREYGCHALALNLLGNVLRLRYQGDVKRRDTIKALVKPTGSKESRHAFKVMQAYEEWFASDPEHGPELALLHLLGLFDHPIGKEVLQVLWDAQIPHLTSGIDQEDWLDAIAGLREEHHLLSQHVGSTDLDCHPLIREYFGKQLQEQQPEAWQQAHKTLYEYYKALPKKKLPDTLEEMLPLFSAVAHGCAAGLHQQALYEVYWPRIQRKKKYYCAKKLGAFSDDLATVAHFFTVPWYMPAVDLQESLQARVLNWAGAWLRALGRLREALEPMQEAMDLLVKQGHWTGAAINASNLSELQLTLGQVSAARESGQRCVDYADLSGDMFQRMGKRTTQADTLHQAGEAEAALALFREAEQIQQERQPKYPCLYSLAGFRYCDLLLAQGRTVEVLERAKQTMEWWINGGLGLLSIALDQLSVGRAHFQLAQSAPTSSLNEAVRWLDQAVASLRAAGTQHHIPHGLLSRAALYRHTKDFTRAHQDLQEVFDIADPSGMRLHLTDYHLEMARLLLAEGKPNEAKQHRQQAADLIAATGYKRRLPELEELSAQLGGV